MRKRDNLWAARWLRRKVDYVPIAVINESRSPSTKSTLPFAGVPVINPSKDSKKKQKVHDTAST